MTEELRPELEKKLLLATPNWGDYVLYCPSCEFMTPTNSAFNPYGDHGLLCSDFLRIYKNK